jgi:hypothetical protein
MEKRIVDKYLIPKNPKTTKEVLSMLPATAKTSSTNTV